MTGAFSAQFSSIMCVWICYVCVPAWWYKWGVLLYSLLIDIKKIPEAWAFRCCRDVHQCNITYTDVIHSCLRTNLFASFTAASGLTVLISCTTGLTCYPPKDRHIGFVYTCHWTNLLALYIPGHRTSLLALRIPAARLIRWLRAELLQGCSSHICCLGL
jgi:hypothetical protein